MKNAILFNHQKWTAVSQRTYINGFWQAAQQISHLKIRQCVEKEKTTTQMSLGAHKHLHKEEKLGKGKLMNLWLGLFSHGCSVHLVFCLEV